MTRAFRPSRRAALAFLALAGWPAVAIAQPNEGPRPGRYRVYLTQGTGLTRHTQDIVLSADGQYEIYHQPAGNFYARGRYDYDPAAQRVRWLSGPNLDMGRGGSFSVRDGGRVHVIRMGQLVTAINGE